MSTMRYTRDHEWLRLDGEIATCGITDYAQEQLGDVVFVELPAVGASYAAGDEAAVVESVKAAAEVYAPVDGEITAVNQAVVDDPSLVNSDPTGAGWFFRIRPAVPGALDELMDEAGYREFTEELG